MSEMITKNLSLASVDAVNNEAIFCEKFIGAIIYQVQITFEDWINMGKPVDVTFTITKR